MKLLKILGVVVVLAGAGLLVTVYGLFNSHVLAQGRPFDSAQGRPFESDPKRQLTILDGRGGRIGVSARDLDAAEADRQKVQGGVMIDEVEPDSPAEKAGLKRSDVIVEFDGEHVRSARQFSRLVRETAPGRSVKATIVRDGRRSDVQLTPAEGRSADTFLFDPGNHGFDRLGDLGDRLGDLGDRLDDLGPFVERMPPFNFNFDMDLPGLGSSRGRLGVTVNQLTNQLATYFGAKDGVLVAAVTEGSAADKAGLKAGDVITSINGERVGSREDLTRALRGVKDDGEVTIGIVRDKKESSLKAKLDPISRRSMRSTRPA
jgi:C-terminal processing protease CtpA/Prc